MDVDRVIETARAMPIPADQEILHILTQEFIIDDQDSIREPIGMSGFRLEVKVHIVTGAVSAAQNIVKCASAAAASRSMIWSCSRWLVVRRALGRREGSRRLSGRYRRRHHRHRRGTQGAIRHTSVIPIAGDQITNDIAMALRTPTREAEDIKRRYGCALSAGRCRRCALMSPGRRPAESKLSRRALSDVIQPRVEELYELIQAELRRAGFEEVLSSGIVLTGGTSVMPGMVELGEEMFHMPVRLGMPKYVAPCRRCASPHGDRVRSAAGSPGAEDKRGQKVHETRNVKRVFFRMKSWFEKNF